MFYFLINVHTYILLSKAIVIEGRPGGGSLPEFVLVIFIQNGVIFGNTYGYMCLGIMHQREDRIAYFKTNGYLNRDVGEANRNYFLEENCYCLPNCSKVFREQIM